MLVLMVDAAFFNGDLPIGAEREDDVERGDNGGWVTRTKCGFVFYTLDAKAVLPSAGGRRAVYNCQPKEHFRWLGHSRMGTECYVKW